jgi:PsbP-like protein
MNKYKLHICSLIIIACCACSCNQNNSALKNTYTNKQSHFEMSYPDTWVLDSGQNMLIEKQTPHDAFAENVTIKTEVLPMKIGMDIYAQSLKTEKRLLDSNFAEESLEMMKINQFETAKLVYTSTKNNQAFRNTSYLLMKDSFVHTFDFVALDTAFNSHIAIFNSIINSIKHIQ